MGFSVIYLPPIHPVGETDFIPKEKEDLEILLKTFILEKAVYELGYELDNRPAWVIIPLRGIAYVLKKE